MGVTYSKDFFDVVSKILPIKKVNDNVISTLFTKEEDKVYFRFAENGIAVILKSEKDCFDFDSETVGVYNYNEFHKIFSLMKNPELNIVNNKVVAVEGSKKFNYILAAEESLESEKPPFTVVEFPQEHINVNFTSDYLNSIKNALPIIDKNGKSESVNVKFVYDNGVVKVDCYTDKDNEDSFETEFTVDSGDDMKQFSVVIKAAIFTLLPKLDFKLSIAEELVMFNYENEKLSLNIYVLPAGEEQ
jgi:hypothetical protein